MLGSLSSNLPSQRTLVLSIAPVLVSFYLLYKLRPFDALTDSKKRGRAESNDQAGPGPVWGGTMRSRPISEDEENVSDSSNEDDDEHDDEGSESRPPFDYYCMFRPFFDIENENEDKDEEDQVDDDELLDQYNQEIRAEDNIEMKPATEHPEHRWIAMWETWKLFSAWERRASFTNPDFFNMSISKTFHGHGMQEVIENMLVAFDKEFGKKKRDKKNLKKMWAIIAAMMQFLLEIPLNAWISLNEKKTETTIAFIGRAFVSALNELDRAKMLRADSDIKDLGLVITFYLYWLDTLKDQEFELPYRKEVIAYAKKAGIDLKEAGCYGTDEKVRALENESGKIKPLSGQSKVDRWEWKRKFRRFSREHRIGGERYNILKMSRSDRANYALDKKDPLADIPDKAIQDGNVRVKPRGGVVVAAASH